MPDLFIRNTSYLDASLELRGPADILIRDAYIASIHSANGSTAPSTATPAKIGHGHIDRHVDLHTEEATQPSADAEILDGRNLVWVPSFTDGHLHTSQQFLRGRLLDEKPVIWKRVNVPFESQLTEELLAQSARVAALEMIACGTSSFVDAGCKYPEILADEYEQAGLSGRISLMCNDNPAMPESLRIPDPHEAVRRLRALSRNLTGRIRPIYSVTTPTAVSESMLRTIMEAAAEDEMPFETHMNEYASEVNDFIERYGERPFVWLQKQGLLKTPMLAAHAIFLSPDEMSILAEHDIRVIHCPFSNCGKGIPDTPALLSRGICVGFGTDGSGHGGLDLFREMRLFRGLMQVSWGQRYADSQVMPAKSILKMAWQGSSSARFDVETSSRHERIGLYPGRRADLIALNRYAAHLFPSQNLCHSIVESANGSDVEYHIANGRILMAKREFLTLDRERIQWDTQRLAAKHPWLTSWCS